MTITPIRIRSRVNDNCEMIAFAHRARSEAAGSQRGSAARPNVLMLNPFGQEAVRTHRLQRVVADRLARAGHDVLRFDYHATGDSPGEDASASLAGFARDALAAAETLAALTRAQSFTWLGIRLGATVALQAARQLPATESGCANRGRPEHLVLWEPVLDGAAHLKALAADHERALNSTYSLPDHARKLIREHRAVWPPVELMGFEVSAEMAHQIDSLRGEGLAVDTARISLAVTPENQSQASGVRQPADPAHENAWRAACAGCGARLDHYPADVDFDWTSEEALNTALVPAPAVAAIVAAITSQASPDRQTA